ncbi:MAG: hypothetical protein LQ352_003407 [Teloschistes flavicans]|nr:MAG: hypothetical protein LQ352_003407 [Teloschistes flavicans]
MSFHPTEAQSSTIQSGPESKRQPDEQGLANQGQPLGRHGDGVKHTTDPEAYQNPIRESAGAVASDSLAAESSRSGGAFSENRNSEPLSVSGSSSTFNNTDTSGAIKLDPAPDAAEREAKEAWREVPDEARGNAMGDSGYKPSGIRGGAAPGTEDSSSGTGTGSNEAQSASTSSNAGQAPGYISSVVSNPAQTGKPHGKNITEGGFESDDKNNASFNSEVGDENDPGRAALQQFQTTTQTSAGGKGKQQYEITGDGQYDALETDQQL